MPTDNPINPIRNCNPKIHLTPNKYNNIPIIYNAQYEQNKIILGLTMLHNTHT